MGFNDILKKTFLESISSGQLTMTKTVMVFLIAGAISLYIFLVYRVTTRKTFYSKSFNISLVALALITTAIILTVQSSAVISLGMVGALSIVRFRTAVKDPMDLVFLFWAISIGIICGAGLFEIAIIVSIIVSMAVLLLELIPCAKAPMLLVINAANCVEEEQLDQIIKGHTKYCKLKTHTLTRQGLDVIYEIKIKEGSSLVKELGGIENVYSVSLMAHDGEVTY